MQLENYPEHSGRRVRLTESERDRLLSEYEDEPIKYVSLALMGRCGCRTEEAVNARPCDIIKGDEIDRWFLRIPKGKGDKERQTPIATDLAAIIRVLSRDLEPDKSVIDMQPRTVRRWVKEAAEERAAAENDDRWLFVSPHDLRRTWGHLALEAGVLTSVLMQFGGWEDYSTFKEHYLGKHSEKIQDRESEKVQWM